MPLVHQKSSYLAALILVTVSWASRPAGAVREGLPHKKTKNVQMKAARARGKISGRRKLSFTFSIWDVDPPRYCRRYGRIMAGLFHCLFVLMNSILVGGFNDFEKY
jgi:hypothetical protein